MVVPEREMPGMSAKLCHRPMISASPQLISSSLRSPARRRSRSPANSTKPLTMRKNAATAGAPNSERNNFSSAKPRITAGIVATTMSQVRCQRSRRSSAGPMPMKAPASPAQSFQK